MLLLLLNTDNVVNGKDALVLIEFVFIYGHDCFHVGRYSDFQPCTAREIKCRIMFGPSINNIAAKSIILRLAKDSESF